MFIKILMTLLCSFVLTLPNQAQALTKKEAERCVLRGMNTFFSAGDFVPMLDLPFMFNRENIDMKRLSDAKRILREHAKKNNGKFSNVTVKVIGIPTKQKRNAPFWRVEGNVHGKERKYVNGTFTGETTSFKYSYSAWLHNERGCTFGVLRIERVFSLTLWLKQEMN